MAKSGMRKSAEQMARVVESIRAQIDGDGLRPYEALVLMVSAELIRTVSPMRLARAIEAGRKKLEGGKILESFRIVG